MIYQWFTIARTIPESISNYNRFYGGGLLSTIPNLRVFAYAFGSGFILISIIIVQILRRDKKLFSDLTLPLTFMFFYSIVVISVFMNITVPYYYYFSRYVVPYIPIIIILGGAVVDKIKPVGKIAIVAFSASIMLPFSITLAVNKDISNMEYKSYREVMESVYEFEPGSIVILESGLSQFLFNEISFGSGHYVFPVELFTQLEDTSFIGNRNLYYMNTTNEDNYSSSFETVTRVMTSKSRFEPWVTGWTPGPENLLHPVNAEYWVNALTIDPDNSVVQRIDMAGEYILLVKNSNRFELSGDIGFIWTGPETVLQFWFDAREDFLFRVNLLPLSTAVGELDVFFKLDSYSDVIYSTTVDSSISIIEFIVPMELLTGREHNLHIYGETWIPADISGSKDIRELGIKMASVEAIPVSETAR